jgi:hypothetical protein
LAKEFGVHLFVVDWVGIILHQRPSPWWGEQVIWELISLDDQSDRLFLFVLDVNNFFTLAPDIWRVKESLGGDGQKQKAKKDRDEWNERCDTDDSNVGS